MCITLARTLARLDVDGIAVQLRHEFMSALLSVLQSGVVKEEIFLATSTAMSLLGLTELKVHLPSLITYFRLAVGLPDIFPLIVGLIGDLFRVLGAESLPYLDYFWLAIYDLLNQKDLPTKLRSDCIATMMDMANSVGILHFQPYIALALNQLQHSASITAKNVSLLFIVVFSFI